MTFPLLSPPYPFNSPHLSPFSEPSPKSSPLPPGLLSSGLSPFPEPGLAPLPWHTSLPCPVAAARGLFSIYTHHSHHSHQQLATPAPLGSACVFLPASFRTLPLPLSSLSRTFPPLLRHTKLLPTSGFAGAHSFSSTLSPSPSL